MRADGDSLAAYMRLRCHAVRGRTSGGGMGQSSQLEIRRVEKVLAMAQLSVAVDGSRAVAVEPEGMALGDGPINLKLAQLDSHPHSHSHFDPHSLSL
jgi:hypothetical protein